MLCIVTLIKAFFKEVDIQEILCLWVMFYRMLRDFYLWWLGKWSIFACNSLYLKPMMYRRLSLYLFDTIFFSDVLLDLLIFSFWCWYLFFLDIDDGMLAMCGHVKLGLNSRAIVENRSWSYLEIWGKFKLMILVFDGKSTLFLLLIFCFLCLRKVVLAWGKGKDFAFWLYHSNECWRIWLDNWSFLLKICCFLFLFSLFCYEFIHLVNDWELMLLQRRLFQLYAFLAHFPRFLLSFRGRNALLFFMLVLHIFIMLIHFSLWHVF